LSEAGAGPARQVLAGAIATRVFPAAVAEVGDARRVLWREAFGRLTFEADAPSTNDATIFDLASLTKPIATTTLILDLLARNQLTLDEPLGSAFAEWRGADREHVTVVDLLEHASGLTARLLEQAPEQRREFEHDICVMPLEYAPRTRSIYSDLGFLLLGFLIADRSGCDLDVQFERVIRALLDGDRLTARLDAAALPDHLLGYRVPGSLRHNTAPTDAMDEDLRRGRRLIGEPHDNYAAVLGAAGHAGLFGTVTSVGGFARLALRAACGGDGPSPLTPALVALALRRSAVPGSSRALGWDTMLPTSSCGTSMSVAAFGHVGFTGTSLWIDPERERYFVLLTNRACGGGTADEMREIRRAFHDALATI
jgi:CubicO group peptidase (beta-lactamase class C family)